MATIIPAENHLLQEDTTGRRCVIKQSLDLQTCPRDFFFFIINFTICYYYYYYYYFFRRVDVLYQLNYVPSII